MYIFKHSMFYYTPCFIFLSIKWQPEEFFNQILQRRSRLTLTREKKSLARECVHMKKDEFHIFLCRDNFLICNFCMAVFPFICQGAGAMSISEGAVAIKCG